MHNSAILLVSCPDRKGVVASIADAPRTFDLNSAPRAAPSWRPARMSPDEAACVLFTSGSTGTPKGVVNSQRNLLQRVSQSINAAHINSEDRFLTLASLCTIVGVRDLITALLAGASFVLLDTHQAGANEILRVVREHRVSILFSFPALLRSVVQSSQTSAGDHLRLVRIGGDTTLRSDISLLRAWLSSGAAIQLIYAATEAPMMQWFVGDILHMNEERMPIGYPLRGNELTVVDADGSPTPDGEVGELVVRSPYVALGNWSRGCCETASIQIDAGDPSLRILRTGDLVRRRSDGLYDRIGRKDRQVKIRGARVELDGVEIAIRRHASVRDVGVIVRMDNTDAAKLIAYIEPHENASDILLDELRDTLSGTVPPHMLPSRFYAVPAVPRLRNSKLDVQALRAIDLEKSKEEALSIAARERGVSDARDSIEFLVAHVWRDLLGLALATPEDDFFDLGGDSLGAITMIVALEKALGREVPLNTINQAPTFGAFCASLQEAGPAVYSPLVVIKPGHGSPPLFFVHGAGGSVMELFTLGRKMTWSGPVIGIQARGLEARDSARRTVEAMTDDYFGALKARQPKGPYLLGGFSFGGLVAVELARRLSAAGDEVAFVGLLDSLPPGNHFLRVWTWAGFLWRQVGRKSEQPVAPQIRSAPSWTSNVRASLRRRAVAASALWASIVYRPRRYTGELTLFETSHRELGLSTSSMRWSPYAGTLRMFTLQGRHLDVLTGVNAETTAELLTQCLEAAMQRSRAGGASKPVKKKRIYLPEL